MGKKLPIFYSALLLTGVNLLLRLISTSFQVYLSGQIGAAGIGLLQLVMSTGALAMTAGMAGIRTATMYLTAEELGKKRPQNVIWVLSGCMLYSILCSAGVSLSLWSFAPWIAENWLDDIRTLDALRLYACFIPLTCLCGMMIGYFTAANRIGTLAIVEIIEQLLYILVSMAILTLWANRDPVRACQSLILGSGISSGFTLLCLTVLRLREKAAGGARIPVRSRLLHTAVPLALADDLRTGISTTENLMVPKRLALFPGTDAPLAVFGTVCGMVFPIIMFPAAILFGLAELLIPELARCAAAGSKARIQYLTTRSLQVTVIYSFFFCGMEYLLAEDLAFTLYNAPDAGAHLRLYALLIPMLYCDAITDAMIKGLGQQKASVRYNIITSAMDVAFLYLLLPRYGMAGYYFSFLVTHLLNFLLSLRRLFRIAGNRLPLRYPLLAALSTLGSILLSAQLAPPLLRGSAFVLIYGCLLVLTGIWGKEDLHWLRGLITAKSPASA